MSQPPEQSPWQPPGQSSWQPPPKKPKAPLVLGILIGALAPILSVIVPVGLSSVTDSTTVSDLAGLVPVVTFFAVLVTGAVLLFPDRTRRWGVGMLIGLFGMLIIGAGACVAVLVLVLASYNGG